MFNATRNSDTEVLEHTVHSWQDSSASVRFAICWAVLSLFVILPASTVVKVSGRDLGLSKICYCSPIRTPLLKVGRFRKKFYKTSGKI